MPEELGMQGGWVDLFRSLGESLLQVFKAELAAIEEDFRRSGVHLKASLGLLGVTLVLLFWVTGLLIFALVALLDIWLPLWGATLIVLALFTALAAVLGGLGVQRLRQVENPAASLKGRLDDHLDWWQHILAETRALDVPPATVSTGPASVAGGPVRDRS
jgi:hypothetical protein